MFQDRIEKQVHAMLSHWLLWVNPVDIPALSTWHGICMLEMFDWNVKNVKKPEKKNRKLKVFLAFFHDWQSKHEFKIENLLGILVETNKNFG